MANETVTVTQTLDQVTVTSSGATGLVGGGTIEGDLNVGVDGTGHDVKFFGADTGKYMQWDQSENKLFVNGEIEVNGTATTFNSTVVTIDDPVFTLGGQEGSPLTGNDSKDRGIEFFYNDGAAKRGFMGYDDSADAFTFLTSATNSNEIFSGTAAKLIAGEVEAVSLDISGDADIDGTLETDALTIGGTAVEAGADVTDATNVAAAGALMLNTGGNIVGDVDIDGDLSIDGTHRIKLGTGISGLQRRSDANLELVVSDNSGQINLVTLGSAGGKAVNFKTHTGSAASATTVASVDESGNLSVAGNISGNDSQNDQGIEFSASALTLRNGAGSGGETITLGSNGAVVNATSSSSFDFTVKSSTSASALHVESSDGNVGIGTASPQEQLHLYGSSASKMEIESAGGGDASLKFQVAAQAWSAGIDNGDGDKFKINTGSNPGSAEMLAIDSSGNVGIGTASPAAGIHLKGDENNIRIQQSDAGSVFNGIEFATYDGTVVSSAKLNQSSGEFRHHNSSSYFPTFYSNNGEAMRIDTSGRVGIGTASPAHLLHVYSSGNGEIEVERASGAAILTQAQASLGRFGTSSNHNFQLMANNSGYVTVTTAGNVGLGTSAPTRELHLDSGDTLTTFKISNSTSGATITDGFDIELSSTTARLNNREGNIELAVSNSNVATLSSDGLSLGDNLFFRCGDSADLTLSHDASNSYIANETGDLYIRNSANDKDIIFQSDDGSGGVETYFFLDGSASGGYPYTQFPDNSYLAFGSGNDLQIRHSGTKTEVYNYVGDLEFINYADDKDIIFQSDDGSGGVETYFFLDGSASSGNPYTVFPDNSLLAFGSGNDFVINHNGTNTNLGNYTGDIEIVNYANDKDIIFKSDDGSGGTTEYFRVDGGTEEVIFSKKTEHLDNVLGGFGSESDLTLSHDGSNSHIANATGDLKITQNANDKDIVFSSDNGSGGNTPYLTLDGSTEQVVFSKALNYSTTLVNDSNYTTTRSDSVILFHSMSTYRYLTLASADCVAGRKIHVKNRDNSEYIYIQTEGSENIDGSSSIIGTQTARGSITLIADGSNWFILNKYST